jgi:hypothetical protein
MLAYVVKKITWKFICFSDLTRIYLTLNFIFQGSQREHSRKVEHMAEGSQERVSGRNQLGMSGT